MNIYIILTACTLLSEGPFSFDNIKSLINEERYSDVNISFMLRDLKNQRDIAKCNAEEALIPASTIKLLVAGAALSRLGPKFRTNTIIKSDFLPEDGVLNGDLYIVGSGDPGLGTDSLKACAERLHASGLRKIEGNIRYDQSFFDTEGPRFSPLARDLFAPPSALSLDYNRIPLDLVEGDPPKLKARNPSSYVQLVYEISVEAGMRPSQPEMIFRHLEHGEEYIIRGRVTDWTRNINYLSLGAARPGLYAATVFHEKLLESGITAKARPAEGKAPEEALIIDSIVSAPISEWVERMLKESDNVVAENLGKLMGAIFAGSQGTRDLAISVLSDYAIENLNWKEKDFRFADSAGLSQESRISAGRLTNALELWHNQSKLFPVLWKSLPRQGKDRLVLRPKPPDGWDVRVKSGTLSHTGVNAIAGYMMHPETERKYAFAIIINRKNPGEPTWSGMLTGPFLEALFSSLDLTSQ